MWTGKAKRLDDIDLPRIGARIGVGEDELHAVLDVETAGGGFDRYGRVKMLFEPHIFHRELRDPAQRQQAVSQGLAYPRWKRGYPSDSYPRLEAAIKINREAAFRSASWGLGQIMGFNCSLAGYASAEAMATAFRDDEETHLEAMVRFVESSNLDDELRAHDWRGFARGYNGSGQVDYYAGKLRAAFAKWQGIRDTPFEGAPV